MRDIIERRRERPSLTLLVQQYIIRLDVSMDDSVSLQIIKRQRDLCHEQHDAFLAEHNLLLDVISQVAAQKQIRHHEEILLVCNRAGRCNKRVILSSYPLQDRPFSSRSRALAR